MSSANFSNMLDIWWHYFQQIISHCMYSVPRMHREKKKQYCFLVLLYFTLLSQGVHIRTNLFTFTIEYCDLDPRLCLPACISGHCWSFFFLRSGRHSYLIQERLNNTKSTVTIFCISKLCQHFYSMSLNFKLYVGIVIKNFLG